MKLEVDKSNWERMKKNLRKTESREVRFGFFEDAYYGSENDNLPVAQVAAWNDRGSENNPQRPFLTGKFDSALSKGMYDKYLQDSWVDILEGSSVDKELDSLGKVFVEDIKDIIEGWTTPSNSPATIAAKGRDDPLVDTGKMYDSVDHKVARRS